ncbi:MAG: hypothetical protein NTY46_09795 [Candidatus Sumerlaeota bacterium]|nr:hypothetical protein [Candidatus Sumerlaeota bacterium]
MLAHLINPRPRIALLGTYIDLYNTALPGHREKMTEFARHAAGCLSPHADVDRIGICTLTEQVADFVEKAGQSACDALVVMSLGYTNSLILRDALLRARLPIVLFNTQIAREVNRDFSYQAMADNHGMQGIQDIASVLVRNGRAFGIVTGLVGECGTIAGLMEHLTAARAQRLAHGSIIASFTPPMAGMGDTQADPDDLDRVFGIRHVNVPPALIAEGARAATAAEISARIGADKALFEIDPALTPADHERSVRLEIALRKLVLEHRFAGIALSFDQITECPGIETQPFLGVCKLMGEGVSYAGEGDILTTASGILAQRLCGGVNFTEMYTMDFVTNSVLDTHMAECNLEMRRRDRKPRLMRKEFHLARCEPFAAPAFSLEPGEITLFNLTQIPGGRFRFITLECRVDDFDDLKAFTIPNFKVAFQRDLRQILNEYSLLGGTHHMSMVYGHHARRFQMLARHFGCDYAGIPNQHDGGCK